MVIYLIKGSRDYQRTMLLLFEPYYFLEYNLRSRFVSYIQNFQIRFKL
jgi:hypothetical protein